MNSRIISATSSAISALPSAAVPKGRTTWSRVGAVLAGLVTVFAVTTAVDIVLHATHVYPAYGLEMSNGLYLLATAYRLVIGVAGGYVTARLAPDRPMAHALALGVVGLLLSIAGTVAMWGMGPLWYPLAIIASAIPCSWLGARLRGRG